MDKSIHLNRGFLSPYFSTNNEKLICDFDEPYILITNKRITHFGQILMLLESISKTSRPLLIIADDVEGEALTTLIINSISGRIKVCAIKCPGFGDKRTELLEEIALLTGGQVVRDETGDNLEDIEITDLSIGVAKRVSVTKDSTEIVVDDYGHQGP